MHLVGRHRLVRRLGPDGLSPALVLSRARGQWPVTLAPYRDEEFITAPSGFLIPAICGGALSSPQSPVHHVGWNTAASLAQTTLALDSAYTFNSAGDAITSRIHAFPLPNDTLTDIYFYITGYTGTAANVTTINYEVRNVASGLPGTTLHASGTVNPASATGWIHISGLSFAMVQGTAYAIVIADADGNITDYATVLRNVTVDSTIDRYLSGIALQTTGGWASGNATSFIGANIVLAFSSGAVLGRPFALSANSGFTTNQRGLYVTSFTEQIKLAGFQSLNTSAGFSGINLWEGATGPAGSAAANGDTVITDATLAGGVNNGFVFDAPYTCLKNTVYRVVLTYGSSAAVPPKMQIGTGADANLRKAMLGGSAMYWAEANAAIDWSNDDLNAWPDVALLIEDQVAVSRAGRGFRRNMG